MNGQDHPMQGQMYELSRRARVQRLVYFMVGSRACISGLGPGFTQHKYEH